MFTRLFRGQRSLLLENLAPRQQLTVMKRHHPRPRLGTLDRLMRGAHSPTFYGDLCLLSENDRRFLAGSIRYMDKIEGILANTRPVLGVPGRGEVYGYLACEGDLALFTVVNPGLYTQSFHLSVASQAPRNALCRLVFSNDERAQKDLG
jgi:hypothetical protein